ncbi:ankyrin repeat domain-containing protein [Rhodococcus sp. 05-339-2]|uniref:ankyrin repeat domain-containing protein n=1 Tax=Rhodococcoides fascians TaxID=1828 RepID=UPI00050CBFEA|nr:MULTISPECIES: ankyrin repeat domain-containing protein [Rhodococcus]OZD85591.1 ankyrin repeat domain-containing protein [Rhodococcus sp. 05-339-2]
MTDRDGRIPLHYAAKDNDLQAVHTELAAGVDVNATDKLGFTPLHFAAQEGATQAATALIERGAEVDAANAYGNAPLWVALLSPSGTPEMLELLRASGADVNRPNKSGRSALDVARILEDSPVRQVFSDLL